MRSLLHLLPPAAALSLLSLVGCGRGPEPAGVSAETPPVVATAPEEPKADAPEEPKAAPAHEGPDHEPVGGDARPVAQMGHTKVIHAVAMSPDGRLVLTGSDD